MFCPLFCLICTVLCKKIVGNFLKMLLTFISFADIINITVADITSDVISARDRKESALMKCPVCGKEMEKGGAGYTFGTRSTGGFFWAPNEFWEKSTIATKGAVRKAGGKVVSLGWSVFENEMRDAWYCRDCELVLIDTKNER